MAASALDHGFMLAMSDTHGLHRTMQVSKVAQDNGLTPENTIVVHSGFYSLSNLCFLFLDANLENMLYFLGDINVWPNNDHTLDFNNWIAEDPFLRTIPKEHKFVVFIWHWLAL